MKITKNGVGILYFFGSQKRSFFSLKVVRLMVESSDFDKGPFTYHVITKGEGGLGMITLM